jgi:hypothetical protein
LENKILFSLLFYATVQNDLCMNQTCDDELPFSDIPFFFCGDIPHPWRKNYKTFSCQKDKKKKDMLRYYNRSASLSFSAKRITQTGSCGFYSVVRRSWYSTGKLTF